jgi:tetratricopeptide (TPR) repeat protein
MLKKRIYIALCILLLICLVLLFSATKEIKVLKRDPVTLMHKYYQFKEIDPPLAKKFLLIILKQDKHYLPALEEYSQWVKNEYDSHLAESSLEELHRLLPHNDTYSFQLGYLYYKNGDWQKAKSLFVDLIEHAPQRIKVEAEHAIAGMASYLPYYQYHTKSESLKNVDNYSSFMLTPHGLSAESMGPADKPRGVELTKPSLLDQFYSNKNKNRLAAKRILTQLIRQQPTNVQGLREAGFLAINEGRFADATAYFKQAHQLEAHPPSAMQLAYLYDQIGNKPEAYKYFQFVAHHTQDKALELRAQNALTNLAGLQTKALPPPYFSEVFFTPFVQSRFGLTVEPFIWRLGVEQDNQFRTREYLFFRRVQDGRSANLGELSQIYEDNVQITGMGAQFMPVKRWPIIGFIEAGQAYDLIYRNRDRWRGDLRGGFMYYQERGAPPAYFDQLKIAHGFYSTYYGDATYFSRYNNNVIGLARTHQGVRLLQYKSSMVNLYATGRILADTRREFFNNFAEVGPGIAFIPSNRFNVQLRLEHVNGVYLPAGATPNPYGKYYTNNVAQLLFYARI